MKLQRELKTFQWAHRIKPSTAVLVQDLALMDNKSQTQYFEDLILREAKRKGLR